MVVWKFLLWIFIITVIYLSQVSIDGITQKLHYSNKWATWFDCEFSSISAQHLVYWYTGNNLFCVYLVPLGWIIHMHRIQHHCMDGITFKNWWLHRELLCVRCLQNVLQVNVKTSVSILQKRSCLLSRIVKPAASNLGLTYFSTVTFHLENKLHKLVNHVSISWGASQKSIFSDAIIAAPS